ncbi:MAG TPA: hypothetical protein VF875_11350 [Anaeromyxobacter sp.]
MSTNPELRRNLWLEVTPARLLLLPLVLAGVFYVAYDVDQGRLGSTTATVALAAFAGLTWLWGAHLASESVLAELRGRTWDWQRMSGLGPWTLAWGKLAGATAIPWYGGALCLAVYAAAQPAPATRKGWIAALFVLAGVLAQAATLLAALYAAGRERATPRLQSVAYLLVVVLGIQPLVSLGLTSEHLRWYRDGVPPLEFAVASLGAFAVFALAGVWVRMRCELRVRTVPLLWPAFVLFAMGWAGGFAAEAYRAPPGAPILVAFGVAIALTWTTALVERKDPVAFRRIARALREGRWRRAAEDLPPWLVVLPFVLAGWAALVAVPELVVRETGRLDVRLAATAAVLFLLRDLALFLYLALGARPRRAEVFAIVLLLVGYVLVPLVLSALRPRWAAALFYPSPDHAGWSVAGALVQAAIVGMLLVRRWRVRELAFAGPAPLAPPGEPGGA